MINRRAILCRLADELLQCAREKSVPDKGTFMLAVVMIDTLRHHADESTQMKLLAVVISLPAEQCLFHFRLHCHLRNCAIAFCVTPHLRR